MMPGWYGKAAVAAGITRRVPGPGWALAVCALFALAGVALLDDYGVSIDELLQREITAANLDYIRGDQDALHPNHNRYYGVALELPLLLAERGLGLDDIRNALLTRHLLSHLFFLAGGFFGALLAYRLFGSKWLALFTLLLFLLHPRLYAHSFFNSKDIPAACMLMIALYLTHRAFRRDTIGAFLLAGAGVALAMNLRIMGAMLFPAVLALRGCDLWYAAKDKDGAGRRRVLLTAGAFLLAGAATLYATMPYLWNNLLALPDAFATLSRHTNHSFQLFQGELVHASELPARYLPTWIAITTPPGVLLLSLAGAAAVCGPSLLRPGAALRSARLRFGLLLAGCFTLPLLAVIALDAHMYDGWRQMYLLYAPLCLLAPFGLYYVAAAAAAAGRLRRPRFGGAAGGIVRRAAPAGVFGLAAAGLAGVVIAMIQLHPHQQVYFNFLVDRKTPGHLRTQYDLEYWGTANRQALEYLLARHPDTSLYVRSWYGQAKDSRAILPAADRQRIILKDQARADFYISIDREYAETGRLRESILRPVVHRGEVYNNTIYTVEAMDPFRAGDAAGAAWQKTWEATVSGAPSAYSDFNLYLDGDNLTYAREPCTRADTAAKFFLHIIPVDAADLPRRRRQHGFENRDFRFDWHGVMFNGKCLATVALPGYAIAGIRTGQFRRGPGEIWSVALPPRQ